MKTLIGYKVVKKKSLISSTIFIHRVKYRINEWVKPLKKCGPLCVFETKMDAFNFVDNILLDFYSIYKCLYEPSEEKGAYVKGYKEFKKTLNILSKGTVLANRVKLIKKEKF